jgi:hypothetical protein
MIILINTLEAAETETNEFIICTCFEALALKEIKEEILKKKNSTMPK